MLLLLIIITVLSSAQSKVSMVRTEENLLRIAKKDGTVFTTNMDELYEGVRGTPYLFNKWKRGNVYLNNNTLIKNVNIKYNIYTDDLLYLNSSSGDSLIIDRSKIYKFEIIDKLSDDIILIEEMQTKPGKPDKKTFVRVIYDGKSKFILKYIKSFIRANYKGAYASGNKYDEYTDDQQYFIFIDENNPAKIKLNKKSFIKTLSAKEDKVKAFISMHNLTLKNENEVVELLEYYDSLVD